MQCSNILTNRAFHFRHFCIS